MFHPQGPTFVELAHQALSSTERGYDLLAEKFDYTPFRTPDIILDAVRQQLTPMAPFEAVLDVCCGTGAALQWLMPLCTERMVGVDFSRGMLAVAQRQLPAEDDIRLSLVRADALAMAFEREFDLAVCLSALGHIRRRDEILFLRRIYQSLRAGGRFVFVTHQMPPLSSARYWLARGFNAAMYLRNLFVRPPFVMFYLTFLWPHVLPKLEHVGFTVRAVDLLPGDLLPGVPIRHRTSSRHRPS